MKFPFVVVVMMAISGATYMKRFVALLIACVACFSLMEAVILHSCSAADAATIPPMEQLEQITLVTKTGWMLSIQPNGSGKLIFGSNPTDAALLPEGSFVFRDIYNALTPRLLESSGREDAVGVVLRIPGQVTAKARYVEGGTLTAPILAAAKERAKPLDQARFQKLLLDQPLAPTAP